MRLAGTLLTGLLVGLAVPAGAQVADAYADEVSAGEAAATAWLALVDSARYQASWDSAAAAFRGAVSAAQWEQSVVQARGPFEPLGARTLIGSRYADSLPNAPPGPYVLIQYRTGSAAGGHVIETVVPMREPDGDWRVSGYFVRPE